MRIRIGIFFVLSILLIGGAFAEDCPPGKTWDNVACECVCAWNGPCPAGQTLDPGVCRCACEAETCSGDKFWDFDLCRCVCPHIFCGGPKHLDDNCNCVCDNGGPFTCSPKKVWNNAECACECQTVETCLPQKRWDKDICECVCEVILTCTSSDKRWDSNICACVCNVPERECGPGKIWSKEVCDCICEDFQSDCGPNKVWNAVLCRCDCLDLIPCGDLKTRDPVTCNCECNDTEKTCDEPGMTWEESICGCLCLNPPTCQEGEVVDPSTCRCVGIPIPNPGGGGDGGGDGGSDNTPIEVEKVWSDQYPGSDGNYLPGGPGADQFARLIVGSRTVNSERRIFVKAKVKGPSNARYALAYTEDFSAFVIKGDSVLKGSNNEVSLSMKETYVSMGWDYGGGPDRYNSEGPGKYVIVAGRDINNNGGLSVGEVTLIDDKVIWPVIFSTYSAAEAVAGAIQAYGSMNGFFYGCRFMGTFRTHNVTYMVEAGSDGGDNISFSIPSTVLGNNIGCEFISNVGGAVRYDFSPQSSLAYALVRDAGVRANINLRLRDPDVISAVSNHVWGSSTEHTFVWDLYVQDPTRLITTNADLFVAIGRFWPVGWKIHVTVRKEDSVITKLRMVGVVEDTYDWSYNHSEDDRKMVAVQAGYNTMGIAGNVFSIKVTIDNESPLKTPQNTTIFSFF